MCVLNAKYTQLLKMQMSLLFQKENEPEQKKNQPPWPSMCADSVVGTRLSPPLDATSRRLVLMELWGLRQKKYSGRLPSALCRGNDN